MYKVLSQNFDFMIQYFTPKINESFKALFAKDGKKETNSENNIDRGPCTQEKNLQQKREKNGNPRYKNKADFTTRMFENKADFTIRMFERCLVKKDFYNYVLFLVFMLMINKCWGQATTTFEIAKGKEYPPKLCSSLPSECPAPQSTREDFWSRCYECLDGKEPHCVPISEGYLYICASTIEDLYLNAGYFGLFQVDQNLVVMRPFPCPKGYFVMGKHDSRKACSKHLQVNEDKFVIDKPGTSKGEPAIVRCKEPLCPSKKDYDSTFPYTDKIQKSLWICIECGNLASSKQSISTENPIEQYVVDGKNTTPTTGKDETPSPMFRNNITIERTNLVDTSQQNQVEDTSTNSSSYKRDLDKGFKDESKNEEGRMESSNSLQYNNSNVGVDTALIFTIGIVAVVVVVAVVVAVIIVVYKLVCKQRGSTGSNVESDPEKSSSGSDNKSTTIVNGDYYSVQGNRNVTINKPGGVKRNVEPEARATSELENMSSDETSSSTFDVPEEDKWGSETPLLHLPSLGETSPIQETNNDTRTYRKQLFYE